jgi:hypothetical protein
MLSDERFVGVASKISRIIGLGSNTELTKISSDFVCLFMSLIFFQTTLYIHPWEENGRRNLTLLPSFN